VAAILHDVGLYPSESRGGVYTADGAALAREILAAHGWTPVRAERCAKAIDCHHDLRSQLSRGSEAEALRLADRVDLSRGLLAAGISRPWLRDLWQAIPRQDLARELAREIARALRERPLTMLRIFLRPSTWSEGGYGRHREMPADPQPRVKPAVYGHLCGCHQRVLCACAVRPGRSRVQTAGNEGVDVAQTVAVLTRAGTVLVASGAAGSRIHPAAAGFRYTTANPPLAGKPGYQVRIAPPFTRHRPRTGAPRPQALPEMLRAGKKKPSLSDTTTVFREVTLTQIYRPTFRSILTSSPSGDMRVPARIAPAG
jgi:hypothetical protein